MLFVQGVSWQAMSQVAPFRFENRIQSHGRVTGSSTIECLPVCQTK